MFSGGKDHSGTGALTSSLDRGQTGARQREMFGVSWPEPCSSLDLFTHVTRWPFLMLMFGETYLRESGRAQRPTDVPGRLLGGGPSSPLPRWLLDNTLGDENFPCVCLP